MTRINAGIPPKVLSRAHLLAEHREIKRVPNNILKRLEAGKPINISGRNDYEFTLGTGHVVFFHDRIFYLYCRYLALYNECCARGYKVEDYSSAFIQVQKRAPHLVNSWTPYKKDKLLLIARLKERDPDFYTGLKPMEENI